MACKYLFSFRVNQFWKIISSSSKKEKKVKVSEDNEESGDDIDLRDSDVHNPSNYSELEYENIDIQRPKKP